MGKSKSRKCCMCGFRWRELCKIEKNRKLHFHTFPRQNNRRKKWIVALRKSIPVFDVFPYQDIRICSFHFKSSDYDPESRAFHLKKNAVPTRYLFAADWEKVFKENCVQDQTEEKQGESNETLKPPTSDMMTDEKNSKTEKVGDVLQSIPSIDKPPRSVTDTIHDFILEELSQMHCHLPEMSASDLSQSPSKSNYNDDKSSTKSTQPSDVDRAIGETHGSFENIPLPPPIDVYDVKCESEIPSEDSSSSSIKSIASSFTYECSFCDRVFTNKGNLRLHKRWHRNHKTYTCKICGKILSHYLSWDYHFKLHQGERPYSCQYCEKSFITNSVLNDHIKRHRYNCQFCSLTFTAKFKRSEHTRKCPKRLRYRCKFCNKRFLRVAKLELHEAKHEIKKVCCKYCKNIFPSKEELEKHLKETGENLIICCHCLCTFKEYLDFKHHLTTAHPKGDVFVCTECNDSFSEMTVLEKHVTKHMKPLKTEA